MWCGGGRSGGRFRGVEEEDEWVRKPQVRSHFTVSCVLYTLFIEHNHSLTYLNGHSAGSCNYPWPHKLPTASYLYLPAIAHQSATESGSRGASLCQTVRWTLVYWEYLSYSLSAWYGLLTKVTLLHRARRMVYLSLYFRVHATQVPSSLHMVYRSFIVIIYPILHMQYFSFMIFLYFLCIVCYLKVSNRVKP